ncbi:MAG: amidohydrolase family protein [Gemmatimonadales bacterium]
MREVLDNPLFHLGEPRDLIPGYAFTPDSKAIVAAYGGKIHRIDLATGRTAVIPFVAEVERRLGPLTVYQFPLPDTAVRTRSVMHPAISPDGIRVAFSALDRIWTMDLPRNGHSASMPQRLTSDSVGEFYPSWSPDGEWIAYSTWTDGEGGAIRRAAVPVPNAPPAASQRLTTDTAVYFQTAMAADGQRIVAVRGSATPEQGSAQQLNSRDFKLVWIPTDGSGHPRTVMLLESEFSDAYRYPVDQVYFTDDASRIHIGLTSWSWNGQRAGSLTIRRRGPVAGGMGNQDVAGALSPNRCRALIEWNYVLFELYRPACGTRGEDTLDLELARTQPTGAATDKAYRWGTSLGSWISWSPTGRRVIFSQGGALFVGDVRRSAPTTFERVDVPLMVPVDMPHGTVVFRGARLITMRGNEVIERGDIVVRDNRIVAVGPAGHVSIPIGARILDLPGTTIVPGYVDMHEHLAGLLDGVHPQQLWGGLTRLAHGVTAVRVPSSGWGTDIFTYRERERTGELLSPRIFSTGIPYHGTTPPIRTVNDARERVRANADYFASEMFKVYDHPGMGRRTRQLLAMATAAERLNATVHTNGVETQLASVIDGLSGIEHVPGIAIYDDLATIIARSGSTQTHTYFLNPGAMLYMVRRHGDPLTSAKMRRFIPPSGRSSACGMCVSFDVFTPYGPADFNVLLPLISGAARIAAKGGRVGIGEHGELSGLGFHWEMWLHALGGMPTHEVLRSATIVGATALGHANDLGSLEPGKLADLQVLEQNPLANIHHTTNIRYVMKNGRLYQADDLTEIWPRRWPLPSIYVWDGIRAIDSPRSSRTGPGADTSAPGR